MGQHGSFILVPDAGIAEQHQDRHVPVDEEVVHVVRVCFADDCRRLARSGEA
jgi:hypothetical protein